MAISATRSLTALGDNGPNTEKYWQILAISTLPQICRVVPGQTRLLERLHLSLLSIHPPS